MAITDSIFPRQPLGMNLRNAIIRELNSSKALQLAKDKIRCKHLLAGQGIPVPETYMEIYTYADMDSIKAFPEEFVVKPNHGLGGNGIIVLKREGDSFVTPSGHACTQKEVLRHIRKILDGEFTAFVERDSALLEERLYPSRELPFSGMVGLPDIRVLCFKFKPVMAMLRYPTSGSRGRANLTQGAIGLGIDIASGRITHAHVKSEKKAIGLQGLGVPPSFAMPRWREMKEIAGRASELCGLYLAGVDIVLDSRDRVLVLEVNGRPGIEIQNINELSLLEALRS